MASCKHTVNFLILIIWIQAIISCTNNSSNNEDRPVFAGSPPVIFSEIYAANTDYKDEFDDKPGWVEFYNPAEYAVNLKGYSLTNDAKRILWTFDEVVVQPHSYLVVFLSGRDKPNLNPPSDSIDLINVAVNAWAWADIQGDPPGKSTALHSFSKSTGLLSGTLKTMDNSPAFNWSSAVVMLNFSNRDLSQTNQILLRGYLSKNSKLEVRIAQEGMDDWQSWPAVITGTGIENDLYTIELPPSSDFPNLKKIYGLRFSNTANFYGTINFSFNSIIAHKRGSDVHASFELSRSGGKLFLMDDLQQIRDSVAYPAEVLGLSFAKDFENGKWALSKPPTPNSANSNEIYAEQAQPPVATSIPRSGYFEKELSFALPPETERGIIHCDTSGAVPSENSTLKSGSVLNLTKTAIMRCAQFKSGAYPSEPILRTYIIGERLPDLPVVSIAVDPKDMFDPVTGLYSMGPDASPNSPHYGANYWEDTQLPIQIDFFESGARLAWSYPAGIQIFGNYSRGHPKKSVAIGFKEKYGQKNLKYSLLPEHPNLTKFKWFLLRNNGNNFGKDYIRDMLMTSLTEGLGIDYQKGRSVIVYYNGEYFGIHNLRERSNGDYFETNHDIDEDFIDLVKGNNEVSRGSDADYQDILRWLGNVTLNDENLSQLERRIDVDNYTNYMQSEIYFANKDWPGNNLKRWRSNRPLSKWKWFLYDTDFGFGSINENPSVKMLDFATEPNGPDWPNPPHSTLILRKLLENQNYRNAFINRFSLLLATYFTPARVEARINALMTPIANEIPLDQKRWNLNASTMSAELTKIRNFGMNRSAQMQTEIEEFFGLGTPVNLTLSVNGNGKILVHNLHIPNASATFNAYPTVPVTIKAVPNGGTAFKKWSDGNTNAERIVTITQSMTLTAEF
ncbi:MAG: CotH kinase family protein [Fibromonadales bacterium]|nr:CotH kinase family protein [Fibromonadales bacterium]